MFSSDFLLEKYESFFVFIYRNYMYVNLYIYHSRSFAENGILRTLFFHLQIENLLSMARIQDWINYRFQLIDPVVEPLSIQA